MVDPLSDGLSVGCLLGALWALVLVVANRPMLLPRRPTRVFLGLLAVLEVGLLAQAVVSTVLAFSTDATLDAYSLAGYAITVPLILPLALVWGLNDRSRWGAGVVLVGLVTVAFMILRMQMIWDLRA